MALVLLRIKPAPAIRYIVLRMGGSERTAASGLIWPQSVCPKISTIDFFAFMMSEDAALYATRVVRPRRAIPKIDNKND